MIQDLPRIEQQRLRPGDDLPIPMELDPDCATPIFGTAQPSSGPADALRRQAYSFPAHAPQRWLLLLAADRVEIGGTLARETLTPGQQGRVVRHFARQARSYPTGFTVVGALALAAWLWSQTRRPSRPRVR